MPEIHQRDAEYVRERECRLDDLDFMLEDQPANSYQSVDDKDKNSPGPPRFMQIQRYVAAGRGDNGYSIF